MTRKYPYRCSNYGIPNNACLTSVFQGVGIGAAITLTYALAHTAPPRLKMAPKKEVKKIAPKLTDAEKKKIKQANK